jgi:acyl dehydratase
MLYLEDLHTGMSFETGTHEITRDEIVTFAAQFDPQPFHLDDAAAASTLFGGLAASGWHTAALTMKLLVAALPLAGGVIGGAADIAWPRPTRPGDILQVFSTLQEITPSASKPERGMAVIRSETRNQRGEVLQIFTARVVLQRRPSV